LVFKIKIFIYLQKNGPGFNNCKKVGWIQTPTGGHPVFIAQHATVICWRIYIFKMVWNREGTGAECWGDRFCCGANYWMDWRAALKIRKIEAEEPKHYHWKEGGAFPKLTTTFSPLLIIASYSLLRNMRDALNGTTLISCMHVIRSALHPGFYLNRRIIRWNSKLSNLF